MQQTDDADTGKGPQEGPENVFFVNECFPVNDITRYAESPFDFLSHSKSGCNITALPSIPMVLFTALQKFYKTGPVPAGTGPVDDQRKN